MTPPFHPPLKFFVEFRSLSFCDMCVYLTCVWIDVGLDTYFDFCWSCFVLVISAPGCLPDGGGRRGRGAGGIIEFGA